MNQIENAYYDYDFAFSNLSSFYEEFEEIYKLVSKDEKLKEEMEELVLGKIERNDDAFLIGLSRSF